jgi:hypothetical protein
MAKKTIRQLTTGTFDFPDLIQDEECKYVDKTDLLYELASPKKDAQYFISRPRRFGKSLMLSTLQAMFEGRRELFKGLKLDDLPWECWDEKCRYPVLSFDMSKLAPSEGLPAMQETLRLMIDEKAAEFGCAVPGTPLLGFAFEELIQSVAGKSPNGKVVVLVDEYDTPVQGFLDNPRELVKVNAFLHDFYKRLKINSCTIRFLMMTGVTKLTKLSVFSGLNHLKDRTMDPRFATLLGYTPHELDGALRENVEELGEKLGKDFSATKKAILDWYDGYRFSPDSRERVCNPVSLGSAFESGKLEGYWESTGQTTLIVNRVAKAGKLPGDLENVPAGKSTLEVCDAETLPMASLLYQGGYLTIKDVIPGTLEKPESYILAPPNLEVRQSLRDGYISQVMHLDEDDFDALIDRARRLIAAGDIREVVETMLFSLYAQVPPDWRIANEAEAKRYFQLFMSMCGANPAPEFPSVRGYADAVIETPDNVFVFEFKYNKSSKAAMRQIRERGYADKWKDGPRPVTLVGINFNSRKRNIDIPVIEAL